MKKEYNKKDVILKDETWSQSKFLHVCCGSRGRWRHKVSCGALKGRKEPIETKEELLKKFFG